MKKILILAFLSCTTTPKAVPPAEHHGGHHRFDDAEKWAARFERDDRDGWQKPDAVLAFMQLGGAMRVGDIGAATGYFPVRIARAQPSSTVIGVDIEKTMVDYLKERAAREGLGNLQAALAAPDDAGLSQMDRVLVVNTVHHIEDRPQYFKKLLAQMNAGGQLIIVDFKMGELPFGGPPEKMRLTPDAVRQDLEAAGWRFDALDETSLPHQYMLRMAAQ